MISIRLIEKNGEGIPVVTEKSMEDITKSLVDEKKWGVKFVTDNAGSFYFPVIFGDIINVTTDEFLNYKNEILKNIGYSEHIDNDKDLNFFLATLYVFFDRDLTQSIKWVNSSIKALGEKKPKEMVLKNEFDLVVTALSRLEYSVYS